MFVAIPRAAAFWVMGALLGLLMIAAAAPSPLYAVYQADWHFSAATLTTVFAVYVVALLAAFLIAGRLSDHIGRRPVIIAALLTEIAAMACFITAARSRCSTSPGPFRASRPGPRSVPSAPRWWTCSPTTARSSPRW